MEESEVVTETTKVKGDALEKNVEFIFQSAGFETQRNVRIAKYEVDILAEIGDRNIVIECKNYQNSSLTIRNLIHQWNSKNHLIKASKIILVIAGLKIKAEDYELANTFNIEIWDQETLTELFNLSLEPSKLKNKLIEKIDFKPVLINELYRDLISEFVIYPRISNLIYDDEKVFSYFNDWLRTFIRTELQINGTSKEDRIKHIELFEDTKERRGFFNLLKFKRTEKEYWKILGDKLESEKYLSKNVQDKYLKYMDDLAIEFNSQNDYFNDNEYDEKLIMRLIQDRLYLALLRNQNPTFGFNSTQKIGVFPLNGGKFKLTINNLNEKQANLVNWILTSEFFQEEINSDTYSWLCFSLEECVDKIYRILDEFYGYSQNHSLKDFSL